jgi:hypothetical protein
MLMDNGAGDDIDIDSADGRTLMRIPRTIKHPIDIVVEMDRQRVSDMTL